MIVYRLNTFGKQYVSPELRECAFLCVNGNTYFYNQQTKALQSIFIPTNGFDLTNPLPEDSPETRLFHEAIKTTLFPTLFGRGANQGYYIGSDPEIFLVDKTTDTIIPAFEFLPSKDLAKNRPYWDGFQAEFNTVARSCHEELADSMQYHLAALSGMARAVFPNAVFTHKPVLQIPDEIMAKASDKYVAFGCSPSLNAYGEKPLQMSAPRELPYRFAGCHIHFGDSTIVNKEIAPAPLVKAIDAVLGPVMTLLLQGLESPIRRQFYGKAGEYRLPKHGLEYRVPSSALLVHPVAYFLLFDTARAAFHYAHIAPLENWFQSSEDNARAIINDLDFDAARRVMVDNAAFYKALYKTLYAPSGYSNRQTTVLAMIDKGIKEYIDLDIEANWKINGNWAQYGRRGCSVTSAPFLEPASTTTVTQ